MRPATPARSSLPSFFRRKAKMAPGGGGRFEELKEKLANKGGVRDPGAVAASIGRKKYGKKKMAAFAAGGRRRKKPTKKVKRRVDAMMAGPFGRAVMGAAHAGK